MTGTQCSQDSFWAMSNAELAASTTDLLLTLEKLSQIIRFDHSDHSGPSNMGGGLFIFSRV